MLKKEFEKDREKLVSFSLRAGLSIVFFYAAVSAFLSPESWVGFIPLFIRKIIDPLIFLKIHSIGELILGLWLLSNKRIFYAAILCSLSMISIIVFNFGALDIVFRDIAILFMSISLALLSYKER